MQQQEHQPIPLIHKLTKRVCYSENFDPVKNLWTQEAGIRLLQYTEQLNRQSSALDELSDLIGTQVLFLRYIARARLIENVYRSADLNDKDILATCGLYFLSILNTREVGRVLSITPEAVGLRIQRGLTLYQSNEPPPPILTQTTHLSKLKPVNLYRSLVDTKVPFPAVQMILDTHQVEDVQHMLTPDQYKRANSIVKRHVKVPVNEDFDDIKSALDQPCTYQETQTVFNRLTGYMYERAIKEGILTSLRSTCTLAGITERAISSYAPVLQKQSIAVGMRKSSTGRIRYFLATQDVSRALEILQQHNRQMQTGVTSPETPALHFVDQQY